MPYCTQADITGQLPEMELAGLTDDMSGLMVVASVLSQAIVSADAVIDSYLSGVYSTPLAVVPEVIIGISVDLTIWNLFTRRGIENESRRQLQQDAIKLLADIAKGIIVLSSDRAASISTSHAVLSSSADRIFSAGVLDTY